jgi:hypothetical protein
VREIVARVEITRSSLICRSVSGRSMDRNCHGGPEHNGLEGTPEVLFNRRLKADGLLGLGVRVDDGFLNHGVEPTRSESAPCGT